MSGCDTPERSLHDTATLGAAGGLMYAYGGGHGAGGASTYIAGGTTLIGSAARAPHHPYMTQPQDLKEHGHDYDAEGLAKYNALQRYNEAHRGEELDDTPTHPRSPYHSPHHQSPHRSPVYDNHARSPVRSPFNSPIRSPNYQERSPIYDDAESDYRSQRAMRNWDADEEEDTTVVGGSGESHRGRDSWEGRWDV